MDMHRCPATQARSSLTSTEAWYCTYRRIGSTIPHKEHSIHRHNTNTHNINITQAQGTSTQSQYQHTRQSLRGFGKSRQYTSCRSSFTFIKGILVTCWILRSTKKRSDSLTLTPCTLTELYPHTHTYLLHTFSLRPKSTGNILNA
jgi:hypothetical protein